MVTQLTDIKNFHRYVYCLWVALAGNTIAFDTLTGCRASGQNLAFEARLIREPNDTLQLKLPCGSPLRGSRSRYFKNIKNNKRELLRTVL
jgi:hypothetical protein